jgi:hypothetical protein
MHLGFPLWPAVAKGGALGFPRADGHLPPLRLYKLPQAPLAHHPFSHSSPLRPSSHIWSRARELEETPRVGRCRATGFPVWVLLLPLLCWTGAWTMFIHRTCVIPRRRCSCSACLPRLVWLHDLGIGFDSLNCQRSCGNVIPALGLQRYEHHR